MSQPRSIAEKERERREGRFGGGQRDPYSPLPIWGSLAGCEDRFQLAPHQKVYLFSPSSWLWPFPREPPW